MAQKGRNDQSAAALAAVAEALHQLDHSIISEANLLGEGVGESVVQNSGQNPGVESPLPKTQEQAPTPGSQSARSSAPHPTVHTYSDSLEHAVEKAIGLVSMRETAGFGHMQASTASIAQSAGVPPSGAHNESEKGAQEITASSGGSSSGTHAPVEGERTPRLPHAVGLDEIRRSSRPTPLNAANLPTPRLSSSDENMGAYPGGLEREWTGESASRRTEAPANDDRGKFAHITGTGQAKSGKAPYIISMIATLAWLVLCLAYYLSVNPELALSSLLSWQTWARPQFALGLVLGFVVVMCPVLFVYAAAILFWRAHELRASARSIAEVALHLIEPESTAATRVATISKAIQRELSVMGSGIERALSRANEIEAVVNREIAYLENIHSDNEKRMRDLVDDLVHEREAIIINAERVRATLIGTQDDFSKDMIMARDGLVAGMENAGREVKTQFGSLEKGLVESLSALIERTNRTLGTVGLELGGQLIRHNNVLAEQLTTLNEKTVSALDHIGTGLVESISGKSDKLSESILRCEKSFSDAAGAVTGRLETMAENQAIVMDRQFDGLSQKISERLAHERENTAAAFVQQSEAVASELLRREEELYERQKEHARKLGEQLNQSAQSALAQFEESARKLQQTFAERFAQTATSVELQSSKVADALTKQLHAFEGTVDKAHHQFAERYAQTATSVETQSAKVSDALADQMKQFEETVKKTHYMFAERLAQTVTSIEFQSERVSDTLANRIAEFETSALESGERLDRAIGGHTDRLVGEVSHIDTALSAAANSITSLLQTHNSKLLDELKSQSTQLVEALDTRLTRIKSLLGEEGMALDKTLEERYEKLSQSLLGDIETYGNKLSGQAVTLSSGMQHLLEQVHDGLDSRAKALNETLARRTLDLAQLLGEGGRETLRALESKATDVTHTIDTRLETFESSVVTRIEGAVERFSGNTHMLQTLVEHHVASIDTSSAQINVTADSLREGVSKVLAVLGQTVASLRELIEEADTSFGLVENSLSSRIKETEAVINNIARQIKAVDQTSAITLNDANVLAERIAEQAQGLSLAVNELTRNQQIVDNALETRRQSLDLIVTGFGEKAKTFEEIMQNFTAMMEESFDQALARAQSMGTYVVTHADEVRGAITEQFGDIAEKIDESHTTITAKIDTQYNDINSKLEETHNNFTAKIDTQYNAITSRIAATHDTVTSRIAAQYGDIRAKGEEEKAQTLQDLQTIYGEANRQMKEILSEAVTRMRETSGDITGMTSSIAMDLEETRAELRRVIAELPIETAEQANAMRKIVSDQIKALNELTDIVARTGRAYDYVLPQSGAGETNRRPEERAYEQRGQEQANADRGMNNSRAAERRFSGRGESHPEARLMRHEMPTDHGYIQDPAADLDDYAPYPRGKSPTAVDQNTQHAAGKPKTQPYFSIPNPASASIPTPLTAPAPAPAPASTTRALINETQPTRSMPTRAPASTGEPEAQKGHEHYKQNRSQVLADVSKGFARNPAKSGITQQESAAKQGWLRDLLTRASHEVNQSEEQHKTRPNLGSQSTAPQTGFETISLDMARHIDSDALLDAWNRYKFGERHAFSPALYGTRGQETFEEARQRYEHDVAFRQMADRYMEEFEQLLVEASHNERMGEDLTRSYLVSDTGKAYTLIAHAAGRLS